MTPQLCAHEVIDVVPVVVQALRIVMRAQHRYELSVPQFRTLAFLSRRPGSSLSAAAEHIGLTRPSMSVLIDGLVARDLLLRATDPCDRRRVTLTLTAAGEALFAAALTGAESWLANRLAQLSEDELAAIAAAMGTLRPLFAGATAQRQDVQV